MVRELLSCEENIILIGENQQENDDLVKNNEKSDYWFHLSNLPSCHLILKTSKPSKSEIKECAELVKLYTKYKNYHKLKVDYLSLKYITRTNTLGKVILKKRANVIVI